MEFLILFYPQESKIPKLVIPESLYERVVAFWLQARNQKPVQVNKSNNCWLLGSSPYDSDSSFHKFFIPTEEGTLEFNFFDTQLDDIFEMLRTSAVGEEYTTIDTRDCTVVLPNTVYEYLVDTITRNSSQLITAKLLAQATAIEKTTIAYRDIN